MKKYIGVLCSMLIPFLSFSQEKDSLDLQKIQHLETVIVTGNKKTDPVFSEEVKSVSEKNVQPKNVADLFQNINGFTPIKRGNYAIEPSFRASQYEQLNIQYDGGTKAMYACPNRMDPITTHVVPEEIEKIEIIKGPYSVRYGATFGGIVNFITQKPDYENLGLHGSVSGGYETNGNSYVTALQLNQVTKKYDIHGKIGYRDFGNYEDGDGTEISSSFRSTDYGIKVGYNFTDNQRVQAHWRQSFGRDVLHAGLPMDTDYDNSSMITVDYKADALGNFLKSFTAKAYYSYVDHLMTNFERPSFMMMEASSAVEATTFGGKLEWKLKPSEKFTVNTGLDVYNVARDGSRIRKVKRDMMGNPLEMPMVFEDKVWQDSYVHDYGLFAESKWFLDSSSILTAGFRYDWVLSDIQDPEADFAEMYDLEKRTENNLSATVSWKKLLSKGFQLEAAYGRGVRSANMIERFINHFTIGQDPYEYIGNPNLDAEVNHQFEIGFQGKVASEEEKETFEYSANFYYSFYENYIVGIVDESLSRKYMPNSEPVHPKVFQNLDKAYKTGLEVSTRIGFFKDYFLKAEAAYVYAKNEDLNESLPLTPPFTSRLYLGTEKAKYWWNVQYNMVSKQDNIAESFGETTTPGYQTLDLKAGIKAFKKLTLGVAALNVLDETYYNHLNFSFTNQANFGRVPINDPGRNFSVFVQYQF